MSSLAYVDARETAVQGLANGLRMFLIGEVSLLATST